MSMKNFKLLSIVCAIGVILVFSVPSFAGLGKIAGTVTDEATGEALAGAQVQIVGTTMGAATNAQGQYFILNVPPGTYSLRVTSMGYATKEITNVRSQLDVTTTLDIKLKQTVIEGEMVTIVAERPVIDKTMTATKVSFSEDQVNNILPAATLNEILQTSVTVQAMRGATKRGIGYMIDGVNVTDVIWPTGGGSMGHTNVKHDDTPTDASTSVWADQGNSGLSIVKTSGVQMAQSQVQEVNVIAGTVNAEYAASGGVINLASKDGGSKYSAKLFLRSSMGGLNHAGPDLYDGVPPANIFGGLSAAQHYFAQRDRLLASSDAGNQARGALMNWTPGKYEYGADPRMNAELSVGGPLTSKGNFFVAGQLLNDHGRFPGEFQRQVSGSVKLNYYLTPSNKLTVMSKVDDGGKLLGWKNRQFTYVYMFFLEGQPINDKLATTNYLKWVKTFNPTSFLETMVSYVTTARTYGYQPVNDKLVYNEYGGDWLILDTAEKVDKYIVNTTTRIFTAVPGNDNYHQAEDFGNQIRFGRPGYLYENFKTGVMNAKTDFTKQINFNHELKAGAEFNLSDIDFHQEGATVTGVDPKFPIEVQIWKHKPWNFGSYIQDRIEYEGIIVNAGVRLDGYNYDFKGLDNVFDPLRKDSLATGQKVWAYQRNKDSKTHVYFSPRLGISHPITEKAAMHYSWGIYTTPQNYLQNYGPAFVNYISMPGIYDGAMAPERATAYEIGVTVAMTRDLSADLTAYYRDTRNAYINGSYTISVAKTSGGGLGNYNLPWGYRDSRGFELTLNKRPTPERYFGVFGLAGNLSLSYSYDKGSSLALSMVTDQSARVNLTAGGLDENWDFDTRYLWPSYSRPFNYWRGKLTLMFDFPMGFKLSTLTTYNSAPYFSKTVNVTSARYEETYQGMAFVQTDVRLLKYFAIGNYKAGLFVEALNVFDRLNVLNFDSYNYNTMYEIDRKPWGPFWRATDGSGNPYAGIAREIYAGIEFSF